MKKIVLVDASPRKNGNSEIAVDTLAAALPGGVVGLMMIVAAIAGGLNGGMASIRNR